MTISEDNPVGSSRLPYVPSEFVHQLYKNIKWRDEYGAVGWSRHPATKEDAEVVSSELQDSNNLHAPVLDIDFNASLIPSSTPGHYHLYLDHAMTWRQYKKLLRALKRAGVVEAGWVKASIRRKHTAVRVPWLRK